jgi:hypothetical protein
MDGSTDFIHRKLPDGTWNSICTHCYQTVSSDPAAIKFEDLTLAETRHKCLTIHPPERFTD